MSKEERMRCQRERLERIRARGKGSFIIRHGVLGFGLTFASFIAAWGFFAAGLSGQLLSVESARVFGGAFLAALPPALIAGALWGWTMWSYFERRNWFKPTVFV